MKSDNSAMIVFLNVQLKSC